jgi:hypothetical protein
MRYSNDDMSELGRLCSEIKRMDSYVKVWFGSYGNFQHVSIEDAF